MSARQRVGTWYIERYSNELALAKWRERPREMGRERVERPTETRKKKREKREPASATA
jgi:hypothetical protein